MHKSMRVDTIFPGGVIALSVRFPDRLPVPLHEPFVIGGVYDGNLPLSERNDAIGWVERLNNRFAMHAVLASHGLSTTEIVRQFSRTPILT